MRQGSTIIKTNKTKGSRTTKDSFGCNYSDLLEAAFDKKEKGEGQNLLLCKK